MPYRVQSTCPTCSQQGEFIIGNWPEHLGVYLCKACQVPVNVWVEGGQCRGCGARPGSQELYDHAHAITYLGGQYPGEPKPGPRCPKCDEGTLRFEIPAEMIKR